MIGSFKKFK